ncbi:cytochrome P450 [Mycena metata]|uniref:Cytochrome P450 n=1 Tax=Mycena metata TaxID=1033252 RepID=A0AAD7J2D9_9AGAR|nr:cytochrome P450 [Mycena metata]
MFLILFASCAAAVAAFAVFSILRAVYREFNSPIRDLPGPECSNLLFGHHKELTEEDSTALQQQWVREYGRTLRLRDLFGRTKVYTVDTKAISHFLTHPESYQRPALSKYLLSRVVGPGLLVAEGAAHRQQRRIMSPAFGTPQIRELIPLFLDKAIELREIWGERTATGSGTTRVDGLSWLNKATLDIIGLAGFNYNFNSLRAQQPTELATAFSAVMEASAKVDLIRVIQGLVPILRIIPTKYDAIVSGSEATMTRIGRQILRDSKAGMAEHGTYAKGSSRSRDLFSLLVRANSAKNVSPSQRLSEKDVLAQVPTFLVAGHETTSTAMIWALFALTQNVPAQTRLRAELLRVPTDLPTMEELNALPYLDCVVREALRLYAPVPWTSRVATADDIVPLSTPWTDANGTVHETLRLAPEFFLMTLNRLHKIRISKGQAIMIPIAAINRDKEIWGADADQFIPERWDSDPRISTAIPGIWCEMLTFIGGPRACIGYRFSILEMKALLFTLVRAFEFELPVPADDIGVRVAVVRHPFVLSEPDKGHQMPLVVRAYTGC